MSKLAAMPFFPAEFFADTAHMTPDAAKAYLFLLGHAWLRGARLPNHDPELARLARVSVSGWRRMRGPVMALWALDEDGFYRQKRLSKEYEFVIQKVTQNRQNGKLGGRPKILKTQEVTKANGLYLESETNPPTPTPTPTKVSKEKPIGAVCEDFFIRFWTAYPRRDGANPRKPARDRFRSACKSGADPEAIIAGAVSYRLHCEAKASIGTPYVAQAQTWLNQQRWLDDYGNPSVRPNGRLSPEQELLSKHQVTPEELARIRGSQHEH